MGKTPNLDSLGRAPKAIAINKLELLVAATDLRKKGLLILKDWVKTLNDEELEAVQMAVLRHL